MKAQTSTENIELAKPARPLSLPPAAIKGIEAGKELGDVMDEMFNEENVKQKGGAIGMLTGHLLTRSSVYHQALVLALIPFIHPALFPKE